MSVYCHVTTIILQQLPSCNNHCHAHIIINKFERRLLIAYKPSIATTYCLQHLQTFYSYYLSFVAPANPLQLLPIVCSNIIFLANFQILCLPPLGCCLPMVTIVFQQNALFTSIASTKNIFIVKEKKRKQTNELIV